MKTKYHQILSATAARSGDQTTKSRCAIHFRGLAVGLGGLFLASVFALLPSPVEAQCPQWDVSGEWNIRQNNGYSVGMDLRQDGNSITGTAEYTKFGTVFMGESIPQHEKGQVSGNIEGDDFYVTIHWGSSTGVYRGKVGAQGRIDGNTYDQRHPSVKATWFSDRAMHCASANAAQPEPTPRPVKKLGKAPKPSPISGAEGQLPGDVINSLGAKPSATPTPTPTQAADESSSTETPNQDGKHKKHKHHHKEKKADSENEDNG